MRVSNSSSSSVHEGMVETRIVRPRILPLLLGKIDRGFIAVRSRKQRRTGQVLAGAHRFKKADTRETHGLQRGAKAFRTKTYLVSEIDEYCPAEQIRKHC